MAATKTRRAPINRDALITRRNEAGLTQEELARRAGLDQSTVSRLETGSRTSPLPLVARALAEALGVRVEDLVLAG
jgi:transcriptional regulator with XRE-family HTH domain